MKKLLSLLGVTTMLTSAGGAVMIAQTKPVTQTLERHLPEVGNTTTQINNLKKTYDALSESEQKDVAMVMAKLPELSSDEIGQFLATSKVDFIKNNKTVIENMYLSYSTMQKMSDSLMFSAASLNVDWNLMNQIIGLNFGNSNDYTPSFSAYSPDSWWSFWDWGFKIDFTEGDVNVMRVVNLVTSLYNGVNLAPLESLLKSGNNLFDYLVNIDSNGNDSVQVLYSIITKTEASFKSSGVPFTNEFYTVLDKLSSSLEILNVNTSYALSTVTPQIKNIIQTSFGMSIEELGTKYADILNKTITLLGTTNMVLETISKVIPSIVWNYIFDTIQTVSKQMMNADQHHNGVYIKFQQFLFPQGFAAR